MSLYRPEKPNTFDTILRPCCRKITPMKHTIAQFIKRLAASIGFEIERTSNRICPWKDDAEFVSLFKRIDKHTLLDIRRCYILYQLTRHVRCLEGDAPEIGVYRGGTAKLIFVTLSDVPKTLHLFDTFSGMPDTDCHKDLHRKGDFSDTSLERVKAFLSDCPNVQLYPGLFPETAADIVHRRFCLVHIDVDIYKSVKDCCAFFYDRMTRGGIMIFDDYGFITCPGAKLAVDEFFADKPESPCYLVTGQSIVTKI